MSPVLSLIVYGQVYFLGFGTNIRPTVIGSDNSTAIPAIDQTLDKTQPFQGNQNSVLVPEINRRCGEMGLSEKNVKRPDYTYTPGIGAHKVHTQVASWSDAWAKCRDEGAHLAIINSQAESKLVVELLAKAGSVIGSNDPAQAHIGFHDLYKKNQWVTIEGQSLLEAGFSEWQHGEPNNDRGNERCGSIYIRDGKLNDQNCDAAITSFICELC